MHNRNEQTKALVNHQSLILSFTIMKPAVPMLPINDCLLKVLLAPHS